ncbi:MAG: dihydrodipicolinate synthase family protein [Rhizomicrobium sp.]
MRGLFAMAVTPFDENGDIDFSSIPGLCDFYVTRGAAGLVALGIMGEAQRMTAPEAEAVGAAFLDAVRSRVPVYFGVSSPALRASASLAHAVMAKGAAGVMLAPLANQRHDAQVRSYFEAALTAIGKDVPVILQDYPQETGTAISAAALAEAIDALPQLCALKHEECPGLAKISYLRAPERSARVRTFPILAGNGALHLPQEMARGADGAMTGFSYPEALARTCALFADGEIDKAEDLFDRYLPLLRTEQQPQFGLAMRKYVLQQRGAIACSALRLPGYRLSAADKADIDRLMARVERRSNT